MNQKSKTRTKEVCLLRWSHIRCISLLANGSPLGDLVRVYLFIPRLCFRCKSPYHCVCTMVSSELLIPLGFRNSSKSEQFSMCILALLGRQRTGIVAYMICACYCILHQHVLEGPLLHQRVSLLNWDIRTTAHFFAVSVTL